MRALDALEDLEPLFKIFYTFGCIKESVGKITDKYTENLKKASGQIQAQARPQSFLGQSFAL